MAETPRNATLLLPELESELKTTRRVLEALPDDLHGFRPHERSMQFERLAAHVAEMPALR